MVHMHLLSLWAISNNIFAFVTISWVYKQTFVSLLTLTLYQVSKPLLVNTKEAWVGSKTWLLLPWSNLTSDTTW